jgi:hypothetical protein
VRHYTSNYHRATERWPGAPALAEYYKAIENASIASSHGVVEHVKSFVECVCLTILYELDLESPSATPSTTELLVETLKALGLQNTRGASKLDKVLSAFNKMSDALSEVRNESGPVAHGKDGFIDAISQSHARTFLHVGDALVGALMCAYDGTEPNILVTREPYDRFQHLSERIDDAVSMKASVETDDSGTMLVVTLNVAGKREESVKMRIPPSRLLYALDRFAFIEVLKEIPADMAKVAHDEDEVIPAIETKRVPDQEVTPEQRVVPATAIAPSAHLNQAVPAITQVLKLAGATDAHSLADKIVTAAAANTGTDWRVREPLLARLRISLRRVLQSAQIDHGKTPQLIEQLVEVLKTVPDPSPETAVNVT